MQILALFRIFAEKMERFRVDIEVERIDWTYEPFDDSVYAGWHYDGLPLMRVRWRSWPT